MEVILNEILNKDENYYKILSIISWCANEQDIDITAVDDSNEDVEIILKAKIKRDALYITDYLVALCLLLNISDGIKKSHIMQN